MRYQLVDYIKQSQGSTVGSCEQGSEFLVSIRGR